MYFALDKEVGSLFFTILDGDAGYMGQAYRAIHSLNLEIITGSFMLVLSTILQNSAYELRKLSQTPKKRRGITIVLNLRVEL